MGNLYTKETKETKNLVLGRRALRSGKYPLLPPRARTRIARLMSALGNLVAAEVRKILRNPSRLREALRPRRWRQFFGVVRFYSRKGDRWRVDPRGFQNREYAGYREYLDHQQVKLRHLDLTRYEEQYERLLL